MSKSQNAISPTRAENYPEWYQQVIQAADMAENSPVRGCMVIKPWGYALWENMQRELDQMFKATGHVNAYFPLLIPLSFLEKEAEHVQGFAKECAVVTHHRLEAKPEGGLQPAGLLEEPLIIRPTSETIIGMQYSKWVQSYRDLPLLINQWANVVRWEMRTRMFLRTSEFLWQEGHTAHADDAEAQEETFRMLDIYETFARDYMAMPVIKGEKTPDERFPGAQNTYTIEAMMQDKKALQAGTSHFLAQHFSKSFNISFTNKNGDIEYAWTTSWGVSTRLIGGLIMTHSDDDGLVLPPKLAPTQIILLPIYRSEDDKAQVLNYCNELASALRSQQLCGQSLRVSIDTRDINTGEKGWQAVKKGIPLRVEIGPRDIQNNQLVVMRRDNSPRQKTLLPRDEFINGAVDLLVDIQQQLLTKASAFQQANFHTLQTQAEFHDFFSQKDDEGPAPGFGICYSVHNEAIQQLAKSLKVTARCMPLDRQQISGRCIFTGEPTTQQIIYAKSY